MRRDKMVSHLQSRTDPTPRQTALLEQIRENRAAAERTDALEQALRDQED